jgi:hypothetical protein
VTAAGVVTAGVVATAGVVTAGVVTAGVVTAGVVTAAGIAAVTAVATAAGVTVVAGVASTSRMVLATGSEGRTNAVVGEAVVVRADCGEDAVGVAPSGEETCIWTVIGPRAAHLSQQRRRLHTVDCPSRDC